jgi:hypothetical protein
MLHNVCQNIVNCNLDLNSMIVEKETYKINKKNFKKRIASSGNRTRAARVAGEHSTTEPTMPP